MGGLQFGEFLAYYFIPFGLLKCVQHILYIIKYYARQVKLEDGDNREPLGGIEGGGKRVGNK